MAMPPHASPSRRIAVLAVARKAATVPAAIGAAWTVFVALLICAEVIGRTIFNNPITGMTEFVALSVAPVMFLQLPMLILGGRLFKAELFTGPLEDDNAEHAVFALSHALAILCVLALFGPWVADEALQAWQDGDYMGSAGAFAIPTWPFLALIVAGTCCSALATLVVAGTHLVTLACGGTKAITVRTVILVVALGLFAGIVTVLPYDPLVIGLTCVAALFLFLLLGFPIAVVLILLSAIGVYLIRDNYRVTEVALGLALTRSIANFEFAVVPLFVAMGLVLDKARLGEDAFSVAAQLLRRVRGGLAIATVAANAVFASVVGSSIASAAVFSRVAVGPMVAAGYSTRQAVGTVAGSSVLGMLIPPSLLLIVFGLAAEQSIGKLFVAAVIPGLLLSLAFAGVAFLWAPRLAERAPSDPRQTPAPAADMSAVEMLRRLGPVLLLVLLVLGGIYSGWFTPTEAAGVGLAASVAIALARRNISLRGLARTAFEAGLISAAMLMLIAAASAYTRLLSFSRLPMELNAALVSADLGLVTLMLTVVLVALVLGSVLDSVSIILVLTPIALPLVLQLGADPIWFGIVLVVAVEVGLLTPPFGMAAYVVREVVASYGVTLTDIFLGALPFVAAMLVVIALLILVPSLVTLLL